MHPRNPKLEVYEAGLVVLQFADDSFAKKVLEKEVLTPYIIWEMLQKYIPENEHESKKMLKGFRSAGTAYNKRIIAEWQKFLQAVRTHDEYVTQSSVYSI